MTDLGAFSKAHELSGASDQIIKDALSMMRNHLGMDVGILSEFAGDFVEFRAVDASRDLDKFSARTRWPIEESVCSQVLLGKVPSVLDDVASHAVASQLDMVQELDIGSALALTIRRTDGTPHGMLCFFSHAAEPKLLDHDFGAIRMLARLVEREVNRMLTADAARSADRDTIESLIEREAFEIFVQPITALNSHRVCGYEALCRFSDISAGPAEAVFDFAGKVGMRANLETVIIRKALMQASALPNNTYLSVNAAPTTVSAPGFAELFAGCDLRNVILEMTEHQEVKDYPQLLGLLAPLRDAGLRIAVDDAGTGFSGLHQIIQLQPDMIKLDRALVAGIDTDQAKRAMCAAMVHYAGESGAFLVAEGVETAAETEVLIALGVSHAQGFFFGRPAPLATLNAA